MVWQGQGRAKVTDHAHDLACVVSLHVLQILYPYDKYLKLHKQQQASERPVGLVNCGNTCFANAVLQCLLHTQPLAAFLR